MGRKREEKRKTDLTLQLWLKSTRPPAARPPAAAHTGAGLGAWCSVPAALLALLCVAPPSIPWGTGAVGAEAAVVSWGRAGSEQGQGDTCRSTAARGNVSWIPGIGGRVS